MFKSQPLTVGTVERFLYDAFKECCFARGYTEDDLVTIGLEKILEEIIPGGDDNEKAPR